MGNGASTSGRDQAYMITHDGRASSDSMQNVVGDFDCIKDEDVQALEVKYEELKKNGVQGLPLLRVMSKNFREIESLVSQSSTSGADEKKCSPEAQLEKARRRVAALMNEVNVEAFTNFVMAIDGSKGSELAKEVTMKELMKSRDGVIVVHVYDSTKAATKYKDLPPPCRPDTLKIDIGNELTASISKDRYYLEWIDRQGAKRNPVLIASVNRSVERRVVLPRGQKPSFFVCGYTGRKSDTGLKTEGTLSIVASGQLYLPNIIVKVPPVVDRPRVFIAAIKDMFRIEPYTISTQLMKPGKGDKLICLHIYDETFYEKGNHSETGESDAAIARFRDYFGRAFAMDGVNGALVHLPHKLDVPIADEILTFAEKEKADYLVINPSIRLSDQTNDLKSPVSEQVIRDNSFKLISRASCNVVVCNH